MTSFFWEASAACLSSLLLKKPLKGTMWELGKAFEQTKKEVSDMFRPWVMAMIWLPTVGVAAALSTEVWQVIVLMGQTSVWFDSKYPQDPLYPRVLISSLGAEQLCNSVYAVCSAIKK